jgi:hypothetical protein
MIQLKIKSLNLSEKKGTVKIPVNEVEITETGIQMMHMPVSGTAGKFAGC